MHDIVVVLDRFNPFLSWGVTQSWMHREQGAAAILSQRGYRLHAVVTISQVFHVLRHHSLVDAALCNQVFEFLESQQASTTLLLSPVAGYVS